MQQQDSVQVRFVVIEIDRQTGGQI